MNDLKGWIIASDGERRFIGKPASTSTSALIPGTFTRLSPAYDFLAQVMPNREGQFVVARMVMPVNGDPSIVEAFVDVRSYIAVDTMDPAGQEHLFVDVKAAEELREQFRKSRDKSTILMPKAPKIVGV